MDRSKPSPQVEKTIGRRELLKAIAATGGAVTAATMLPGKWAKPVIEAGVLPAHAQSSAIVLRNLTVPANVGSLSNDPSVQKSVGYQATVDYTDGVGGIDENAELSWTTDYTYTPPTPDAMEVGALATKTYTIKLANLEIDPLTGYAFSGTITFPIFGEDFVTPDCESSVKVTVNYLKASDGRMSNVISNQFTAGCI